MNTNKFKRKKINLSTFILELFRKISILTMVHCLGHVYTHIPYTTTPKHFSF